METNKKIKRFIISALVCLSVVTGLAPISASAADDSKKPTGSSQAKTQQSAPASGLQGYAADSVLQVGTIVQLATDKPDKVLPATQSKLNQMYGVVIDPHTLPITISNGNLQNEAYVSTSGTYNTLVSTQGGAIKAGDYVTMSSIDGVAMKASEKQKTVFGRAGEDFDGKTDALGQSTLKDSTGKTITVTLGMVQVAIDIKHNPNDKSTKTNVPKFLQRLGQAIAEKPVGPLRMYLSIGITGISIIASMIILYSGVRSSIFSIGRNPLSKKSIFRGLLEVIFTSLIILIIGLFAVYLLLKL